MFLPIQLGTCTFHFHSGLISLSQIISPNSPPPPPPPPLPMHSPHNKATVRRQRQRRPHHPATLAKSTLHTKPKPRSSLAKRMHSITPPTLNTPLLHRRRFFSALNNNDNSHGTTTLEQQHRAAQNQHIDDFNQNVSMEGYQAVGSDSASFPSSATLDRLRQMAPSSRPESLQQVKDVQRGNFAVPSPFEAQELVDSTQRIQQHFQHDQREELYPSDQLNQAQQQQHQQQQPQANVGTIGSLENDDEERTFSRTIFYGFGPNHVVMNGMSFQGSVLATPTMTYLWKPKNWEDVTAESITALSFLFPQPDVVLFGCGSVAKSIDPSVHHYLRTLNIPYELMSTYNAMGTFNLMNEEFRKVAAFTITYDHNQQFEKELIKQRDKEVI